MRAIVLKGGGLWCPTSPIVNSSHKLPIYFLENIGSTNKQNQDKLVESRMCTTVALNQIISGEELDHYTNKVINNSFNV